MKNSAKPFALFEVPRQVFLLQVVEDSLSIKELVQLSRASRQALHEVLRPYGPILSFAALRLPLLGPVSTHGTCLKDWIQIHQALLTAGRGASGSRQGASLEEASLSQLISFQHRPYDEAAGTWLEPVSWSFTGHALRRFLPFLWRQLTAAPSCTRPCMRGSTFLQRLPGAEGEISKVPLAVIALDATYGYSRRQDEFFNLAALLLLEDRKVALILAWADEISENEGFFSIVLIGPELQQLLRHAADFFKSPWSPSAKHEWFGFEMSRVYSYEDQPLLESHPGLRSALRSSAFRDLERFVPLMHALRPEGWGRGGLRPAVDELSGSGEGE
ncbi:unnamed protein product [Durusdinium trenchii]|uniref:F-box domain-containing protein n=1 Tax=Durusdinium trenchii TaxID=1381693 RepID=A0ABP0J7J3_9DINO